MGKAEFTEMALWMQREIAGPLRAVEMLPRVTWGRLPSTVGADPAVNLQRTDVGTRHLALTSGTNKGHQIEACGRNPYSRARGWPAESGYSTAVLVWCVVIALVSSCGAGDPYWAP